MSEIREDPPEVNIEGKREEEPKGREVNIYFYRHGEASGEGREAELTENGRIQAREAILSLVNRIQETGGGVIKFLASPVKRTVQTAEVMEETTATWLEQNKSTNIRILKSHERKRLKAPGVTPALKKLGITEDPLEAWFKNPEILGADKTPSQVAAQLTPMLRIFKKVADRLPPGERIHYICVSHDGLLSAVLNQQTGKTLGELGGSLKNCEAFEVKMKGKPEERPKLSFREHQVELEI